MKYLLILLIIIIPQLTNCKQIVNFTNKEILNIQIPFTKKYVIETTIYKPKNKQNIPIVIMGPGKGYHKDLPLFKDLGKQCINNNIALVVFNWKFFQEKTKPSEKLEDEIKLFKTVLKYIKNESWIDSSKIVLAGKSLGSIVAYQTFEQTKTPKALFLYTPIFVSKKYVDYLYPNLSNETRPVRIIAGNKDIYNCPIDSANSTMGRLPGNIQLMIIGGDHSLNIGDYKDPKYQKINSDNLALTNKLAINHIRYIFMLL